MNADEIDKIIAEAQAADAKLKKQHKRPFPKEKVRAVLNTLFMVGFVAAVIIYFTMPMPENLTLFYSVGYGSIGLKIFEFIIRFTV